MKVPVNCLMRKLCSLSKPDFIMIEKRLRIQKNRNKEIKKTFGVGFGYREGDVISKNSEKYYVFNNNNGKIYGYLLTKKLRDASSNSKQVKINGKLNYIYFDNLIMIGENESMKIIDIATVDEMIRINLLRKKIKSKKEVINIVAYKIGTVFRVKNKEIMYLYESNGVCYGVDLLMYRAFPKVVSMYKPSTMEILEIYENEKVKEIVKYLVHNLRSGNKKIRKLYEDICV